MADINKHSIQKMKNFNKVSSSPNLKNIPVATRSRSLSPTKNNQTDRNLSVYDSLKNSVHNPSTTEIKICPE